MKKILLLIFLFLFIEPVLAVELPIEVSADAVFLYDITNDDVVYQKNADKQKILASLTKIMTAYTVIENVDNLNAKVTIKERDISNLYGFTCAGLEVGDRVSYLDLLYAMMLPSGADASNALAYNVGGTLDNFVLMMNEEAQKLGLTTATFYDSFGGDDGNVATAKEVALLLLQALKNETFKKVFTSDRYVLSTGLEVFNYTGSLATYHGYDPALITGSKSGYTPEAGLLLASTATIKNTDYLLIVMNSEPNFKLTTHVIDTYKIYNYVETQNYEERDLLKKGDILKKIEVEDAVLEEYLLKVSEDVKKILSDVDYQNVTYDYHITDVINPENNVGDDLGYVDILVGNEVISTYNVYLDQKIEPKVIVEAKVKNNNYTIWILMSGLLIVAIQMVLPKHLRFKGNM